MAQIESLNHIVKIKFGSHLYGTATEMSDTDIKSIFLPTRKDILLQQVKQTVSSSSHSNRKNNSLDVDYECYTPYRFLQLLAEGQTVALDMFFAPDTMYLEAPHPLWIEIKKIGQQLLNKNSAMFVRYCQHQANQYGLKGERIAAARQVLTLLEQASKPAAVLKDMEAELRQLCQCNNYLEITAIEQEGGGLHNYLVICGKKIILTATVVSAKKIITRIIDSYGKRAHQAEKMGGYDWKALSHAVRVASQAIEFLKTHQLTFPRPEAQHLLAIKLGKVPFEKVSLQIESLLQEVTREYSASTLAETVDLSLIDQFILKLYGEIVCGQSI